MLAWQRFAEAHQALAAAVRHVERGDLSGAEDVVALRACILPTLGILPQLVAWPQLQLQLGFDATALTALVAMKAVSSKELLKLHRQLLVDAVRLVATAWLSTGVLASQPVDHNRAVLRLCATLAESKIVDRQTLSMIAAHCVGSPMAQVWAARYFSSILPGLLLGLSHGSAEGGATQQLAYSLLRQCHAPCSMQILEKTFQFAEAWEHNFGQDVAMLKVWLHSALVLPQTAHGGAAALTPALGLAAFFLGCLVDHAVDGVAAAKPFGLLPSWLHAGLQHEAVQQEELVLQGYIASVAQAALVEGQQPDACVRVAVAARRLVCEAMLPDLLLSCTLAELERQRQWTRGSTLGKAAAALASCLAELSEGDQAALVMAPLEELCRGWARRWDDLPSSAQAEEAAPLRLFFGAAVSLFVGTVARQVTPNALSTEALLHAVRAMVLLEVFREDQLENRAVCHTLLESGADREGFVEELLRALAELYDPFHAAERARDAGKQHWARLASVYFMLGLFASAKLMDCEQFFPMLWPIIVHCVGLRLGLAPEGWWQLAVRAHHLASVCLAEAGTAERATLVQDYLSAGIESFTAEAHEDVGRALAAGVEAAAKDLAARRDREESSTEASELHRWMLRRLCGAVLESLPEAKAAESLFRAFCAAARYAEPASLPGALYEECQLQQLLQAHEPLRQIWLQHLVARFPEGARELLLRCLLDDFPDCAAAFAETEGGGAALPWTRIRGWSAWRMLRSAL